MTKPKSSYLKTLMATASVASIVLGASNAMAGDNTAIAPNVSTNLGVGWSAGTPDKDDKLIYGVAAGTINMVGGKVGSKLSGEGDTFSIDTSVHAGILTTGDAHTYTITAVIPGNNLTVSPNNGATINMPDFTGSAAFTGAGTLNMDTHTLTGSVDFANQAGILQLGAAGKVTGTVDNTGGANGTIKISGDNAEVGGNIGGTNEVNLNFDSDYNFNVAGDSARFNEVTPTNKGEGTITFTKAGDAVLVIGNSANQLKEITWQAGQKLSVVGDIYAVDLQGGAGSTLFVADDTTIRAHVTNAATEIEDTKTLTLGDGTIYDSTIDAANGAVSDLKIEGNVGINEAVGHTVKLDNISIEDAATLTTGANSTLNATSIVLDGSGTLTTGAAVTATTISIASGTFTAGANVEGAVTFTDAGTFDIADKIHTGNINTDAKAARIKINGGTINGIIDDSNAGHNAYLEVGANGGKVIGDVGQGNKLGIDFGVNDSVLEIEGSANLFGTTNDNNKGTIRFTNNGGAVLQGGVGANANYLKEITWAAGKNLLIGWGNLYVQTLNGSGAGSTITIDQDSDIHGTVGANAATTINDGKNLTFGGTYNSTIDGDADDKGTLIIGDNSTLNEAVGNTHSLAEIQINDGKTLTANSSLKATNLTLVDGGKLTSTGTIASNIISIGSGTLTAGGKISGKSLSFTKDYGQLQLGINEFVGDIDFSSKTSMVVLGAAGKVTGNIDDSVSDGKGTLRLEGAGQVTGKIGNTNAIILDFKGDHTLTLNGDYLNLSDLINTTGQGIIETKVASTFKGKIGKNTKALNKITLGGGLTLDGAEIYAGSVDGAFGISVAENSLISANTVQNITIDNAKTLTLVSGTHTGIIDAANAGNGALVIDGAVTLNSAVGATKLDTITINDAKTLTTGAGGTLNTEHLVLTGAGNLTTGAKVTATDISIASGTFIAGADVEGAVAFTDTGTLDMHNNTLTGSVDFAGKNGNFKIADATKIIGAISTTTNDTGNVTIGEGALQNAMGAAGKRLNSLKIVTVDDGNSNGKDIYVNTLKVGSGAGKTFTINNASTIDITNIVIGNGDSLVLNKAGVSGKITGGLGTLDLNIDPSTQTATVDVGTVNYNVTGNINKNTNAKVANFNDSLTLTGATFTIADRAQIANTKTFTLDPTATISGGYFYGDGTFVDKKGGVLPKIGDGGNKLANLELSAASNDISGKYIVDKTNVNKIFKLVGDAEFAGNVSFVNGSTMSLDNKNLKATEVAYDDNVTINMTINSVSDFGKVTAKNNLAGKKLVLNVTSNVGFEELTKIDMFSVVDGDPSMTINDTNKLLNLSFEKGSLFIKVDKVALSESLDKLEEKTSSEDIKKINNMEGSGDVVDLKYQIGALGDTSEEKAVEAANRVVQNNTEASSEVISNTISSTMDSVVGRLASFAPSTPSVTIGVAAGDEDSAGNSGMWAQGFGSRATQSKLKGNAGYKANSMGGIVGADTMLNDEVKLGFAVAYMDSKIKMKNQKSGDRTDVKSLIGSIYGLYSINDNLYTRGMVAVANNRVEAKEKKLTLLGYSTSSGKYTGMNYALDTAIGYNHLVNDVSVTPEVGLRASMFNDAGYTEKGGAFNRTITKRAGTSYDAVVGVSASTSFANGDAVFTPTLTAKLIQNLGGKNPEVSAKINGQTGAGFVNKNKPLNKTMYNLGADLLTNYGMMEYGVSYDANLARKFVSHSGSFKVRVNF